MIKTMSQSASALLANHDIDSERVSGAPECASGIDIADVAPAAAQPPDCRFENGAHVGCAALNSSISVARIRRPHQIYICQ